MRQMSRRQSEEARHKLVARQVNCGVSGQAFYERKRRNLKTFYGWCSTPRARVVVNACKASVNKAKASDSAGGYLDLGSLEDSGSRYEIWLDFGADVVLQSVRGRCSCRRAGSGRI